MHFSRLNVISALAIVILGTGAVLSVNIAMQTQDNRSRASSGAFTVGLKPVADAYVSSSESSTNKATSTKLGVEAGSKIKISYLKFDLSSLAGATIHNVVFRFRVPSDPAQSDDTMYVRVVPDTYWDERAITYNNKPSISSTLLGTISGRNTNSWYSYNLSASAVQPNAGRLFAFAVQAPSSSDDYLEMMSRENSGYEPQLIITYSYASQPDQNPYIPTATPAPYYVPTATPAPYYLPTATPAPYYVPTATPAPYQPTTPPYIGSGVTANLSVYLHGIGRGGDNVNPTSQGNMAPIHPQRSASVQVFNASNQLISDNQTTLNYDSANGVFRGQVALAGIENSGYMIKIKTDQYLRRLVPGIQNLIKGQTVILPEIRLVVGDINGDNQISILDYNILIGCYSDLSPAVSCTPDKKLRSDINDDGNVNQYDYNLFLRELSNVSGQ